MRRIIADVLAGQGLSEVWSTPFVGADRFGDLGLDVDAEVARTVRLANPLSDEQPLMRTRLLATMVDALRRNVARGTKDVGLFELGLVVALEGPQGSAPTEDVGVRPSDAKLAVIRDAVPPQPRHVAFLLAGDRVRAGWWGDGRPADVADVVELARTLGEALGVALDVTSDTVAPFHPGRCALVTLSDGTAVGHVGELHPKALARLGLPARAVGGELDLDVLTRASQDTVQARTLRRLPRAQSDVALVVGESVPAAEVERLLREGAGEDLEAVVLFDVYRGDQVGEGHKSLAYRLIFRAPDRTLTTDEVSALRDAALAAAGAGVGAVQRA